MRPMPTRPNSPSSCRSPATVFDLSEYGCPVTGCRPNGADGSAVAAYCGDDGYGGGKGGGGYPGSCGGPGSVAPDHDWSVTNSACQIWVAARVASGSKGT